MTIYGGQPRDRVTGYHGDRDLFSFGPYASFVPLSGNEEERVVNSRSFQSLLFYPTFSNNAAFFYFHPSPPRLPSSSSSLDALTRLRGLTFTLRPHDRYGRSALTLTSKETDGTGFSRGEGKKEEELIIDFPRFAYI